MEVEKMVFDRYCYLETIFKIFGALKFRKYSLSIRGFISCIIFWSLGNPFLKNTIFDS